MLSLQAQKILSLLRSEIEMDGADIEERTGLDEAAIKAAARELRTANLISTSGAPDVHEEDGMAIDRLMISRLGRA